MTLASKAHVKIGPHELLLDETIDAGSTVGSLYRPHYRKIYNSLFNPKVNIAGSPTKEGVRPERLLWFVDDWSGGENNRTWEQNDPTVYNYSYGMNSRIRGQITGRPARLVSPVGANTDSNGDVRDRPIFGVSQSYLWLLGSNAVVAYTNTASQWTLATTTQIGLSATSTDYRITAAAGNDNYMFYSAFFATTGTNTGSRILKGMVAGSNAVDVQATATGKYPYAGLCMLQGFLYAWTGGNLFRLDVSDPTQFPFATQSTYVVKIGSSGSDPLTSNVFGTKWWANCVATEHSVCCFYSSDGQSTVYEFDLNGGGFTPIWAAPLGLTIKAMQYENSVLFISGHWGGDTNQRGFGFLHAINIHTKQEEHVDFVRRQNLLNLEMQEMAQSYGNQILLAAGRTGRIFVYDGDLDALSMLDDLPTSGSGAGSVEDAYPQVNATESLLFVANDHRIGDMITYGTNRYVAIYRPGSATANDLGYTATLTATQYSYRVLNYSDDEPANRQSATATNDYTVPLEESIWDFDVPFEQKMLVGFDVTYDPLTTGQSFWIQYSVDGGGWKTTTVYNSASADAAKGRTFIDLTSTATATNFYEMKYRIYVQGTGTGGLYYQPPVIKGVCVEAQVVAYDITWDLLVYVKDPKPKEPRQGTFATMVSGYAIRNYLTNLRVLKTPVQFLDGYVSNNPGVFDTWTVTVEDVSDTIVHAGEGTMKVSLRTIPK